MKHFTKILLCMAMVVLFCVAFASCGECDHKWGDWTTVKAATCTEAGSQSRTCKDCGESQTAEIPAGHQLGHWHEAIPATCTTPGSEGFYHCAGCGETVDANGQVIANPAIPALGHIGGTATCADRAICTRCNQAYGSLKPHTYTRMEATPSYKATNATCEAAATYYYSCACGERGTETFSYGNPLNHAYPDAWTSNHDGTHKKVCANDPTHVLTDTCKGGEADCENKAICDACHTAYGNYGDHEWDNGEVTTPAGCLTPGEKTFTCGICGETKTEPIGATGHSYSDTVTPPTCTANGYTTHTCGTCGSSYVDTEVVTEGHQWDREAVDCENGRTCTVQGCGATEPELGHNWGVKNITPATCQKAKTIIYECSRCHGTYDEEEGTPLAHNIENVKPTEELIAGETCKYVLVYLCNDCHQPVNGDTVEYHKLVASVTTEATCVSDGLKTLSCSREGCDHTETEVIPKNENGHKWNGGVRNGNIVTYTCTNMHDGVACTATYTAVDASDKTEAEVKAEDLAQTGDVQLKDAALGLDDKTIESLGGKDVTLSAGVLEGEDLDAAKNLLDEDQLQQLGDNPIYNFTMHDGAGFITSFDGGKIKVTIPYTPAPDEDVDSIAIWYISEGKPVSIKATYSNGYVTFETDHFSYYTVTNLTPAERCELYTHSYTSTTVAPTCTEQGYTLHVCIRCGKTEKKDFKDALGHDYKETVTPATCKTAGKIVSKCENCKHSYQTKLPATGHSWGEPVVVDPTCNTVGTRTYTCTNDNCDATRVEKIAQLKHDMTETVVPPTCEEYGYTRHTCQRDCGYTYDDTVVDPIGHSYTHTWKWSDDLTSASVVFVCQNDATHTFEQAATVTVTEITSGCSAKNRYDAKLVYNGVIYTDNQLEKGEGTPSHNYSTVLKYNETDHWYECVCGDKKDVTAHTWNEGDITKKPTCAVDGEMIYLCDCGAQKTEAVPATGEHSYENGKCVDCGANAPSACDHTELHRVFVDLADHGACGGRLIYSTCKCGEVQVIDTERSYYFVCDTEDGDEESGEDETGEWEYGNFTCPDCGLYAEYLEKEFHDSENCRDCFTYTITIKMGDTVLMNASYEDSEEEHNGEETVLDMSEFTTCGGEAYVYKCKDCGKICDVGEGGKVNCKFGKGETDQGIDENGNPYMTMSTSCSVCGLKQVMTQFIKVDGCRKEICMGSYMYQGETCVFEFVQIMDVEEEHEYVFTPEAGASCESDSPYFIEVTCKNCDMNVGTLYMGCFTETREIDLSEHGFCGCIIRESYCLICGDLKSIYKESVEGGCLFVGSSTSGGSVPRPKEMTGTVIDGVVGTLPGGSMSGGSADKVPVDTMVLKCYKCGGEYYIASTTESNGCVTTYTNEYFFAINGTTVYQKSYTERNEDHEYEYDYEMKGDTCKDGYIETATCTKCGDVRKFEGKGHVLSGGPKFYEGFCGLMIFEYECRICHEKVEVDIHEDCDWEEIESNVEGYVAYQCGKCGGVKLVKRFSYEKDEHCRVEEVAEYVYLQNGKEVYRGVTERNYEDHDLDIRYEKNGSSCEDGYTIYESCKDCDYEDDWTSYSHQTERTHVDLGALGFCGGYVEEYRCTICGEVTDFYEESECDWYHLGDDKDKSEIQKCYTCGGERHPYRTVGEKDQSCAILVTVGKIYYINGTEVHRTESTDRQYDHTYDWDYQFHDGESCEHGYSATGTCVDCGMTINGSGSSHRYENKRTELTEYGFCGGYYEESFCSICEKNFGISYVHTPCYWEEIEEDENGYTVFKCRNCHLTRLWKEETSEMDENCGVTTTITYIYLKNNEELFRYVDEDYDTYHEFDYHFDRLGESCEDGFYVTYQCKNCGYGDEQGKGEYYEWHWTYCTERYDLAEYGCCGGTLEIRKCPCGKETDIYFDYSCMNMQGTGSAHPDGDKIVHVETRSCPDCGLRYTCTWYSERDAQNCQEVTHYTYTYSIGLDLITMVEEYRYEESHRYEITGELLDGATSCEDGVLITKRCLDCGDRHVERYDHHEEYLRETIDLSKLGSVCGGYAEVVGCACGRYMSVNLEHSLCDLDERSCDLWIENVTEDYSQRHADGYHYFYNEASIITCAVTDPEACAFKIRRASYYKKLGNCMAQRYETWQFGYNEETGAYAYEITFAAYVPEAYHEFVRENIDTDSQSGYRDVCSACGSYNENIDYYDENRHEIKHEIKCVNNLNDGNTKSYLYTREYTWYLEDGTWNSYESLNYTRTVYGNGSVEEERTEIQPYTPEAGRIDNYIADTGRRRITSVTKMDGSRRQSETAYVYRQGAMYYSSYDYTIYTYELDEDGYWERYEYTYDFTNGCTRSYVYTNSNGVNDSRTEDCHRQYWDRREDPTCTQDGEDGHLCNACGQWTETYPADPNGHDWFYHNGMYVCRDCGLHNLNGASGDIVMEDLTEQCGEDIYYVVGYWNRGYVKFVYNVSIILENGEMILLEGVKAEEMTNSVRAIRFSKAEVEAMAQELGYAPSEYDVRFAFVPLGGDSNFDYAITFTDDTEEPEVIEGDIEFLTKLGNEGQRYTYTATEDVWLTFTTYSGGDTYGYLENAYGSCLVSADYGGEDGNFKIVYLLTAGETYTLGTSLYWNDNDEYVYVSIAFSATEPSEEEPKDEEGDYGDNGEIIKPIVPVDPTPGEGEEGGIGDDSVIVKPVDPVAPTPGEGEEGGIGDDSVIVKPFDPELGADENGSIVDGIVTEKDEYGTTESEKK